MFNTKRTRKRTKSRLSKVRGVLLLMVAFVVYFSMAKPAAASSQSSTLSSVQASVAKHIVHQDQDSEKLATDESLPLSCDDCGRGDDSSDADSDASFDSDMDEFMATLPHLDLLIHVTVYSLEDMHKSLPPYQRGLEYPPDALV